MLRAMGLSFAVLVAAAAAGCGSSVIQPGLTMRPDTSLQDAATKKVPPTRVHVVGIMAADKGKWEGANVTTHFIEFSKKSAGDVETLKVKVMDLGSGGEVRVKSDDPIWEKWKGSQYLVVLVDLRDKVNEGGSANDPRRLILSLNAKRWTKLDGDIVIDVTNDRLSVRSEQTPVEPTEF